MTDDVVGALFITPALTTYLLNYCYLIKIIKIYIF